MRDYVCLFPSPNPDSLVNITFCWPANDRREDVVTLSRGPRLHECGVFVIRYGLRPERIKVSSEIFQVCECVV